MRVSLGDELVFVLRKHRSNYIEMAIEMYKIHDTGMHYVCEPEDVYEGQYSLHFDPQFSPAVKIPKSLRFLLLPYRVNGIVPSVKNKDWVLPITLFCVNGSITPYGYAQPHILRAMLAMYKVCGRCIGRIIMRAMLETGAINAKNWVK